MTDVNKLQIVRAYRTAYTAAHSLYCSDDRCKQVANSACVPYSVYSSS